MNYIRTSTSTLFIIVICVCCGKKSKEIECAAGNGGRISLIVYPRHHGKPVLPYQVYVRFNATDAPQTLSEYDINSTADTAEQSIKIRGLKCGQYYLYATGYDTSLRGNVKGGIPFTLDRNANSETIINIPVTE